MKVLIFSTLPLFPFIFLFSLLLALAHSPFNFPLIPPHPFTTLSCPRVIWACSLSFLFTPLLAGKMEKREREGNTNERESEWRRDDGVRAAKTGSLFVRSPCCVHPWKRSLFTQKSPLLYSILSYSCLQTPPNHHRHFPSLFFPLASFRPHLSVE